MFGQSAGNESYYVVKDLKYDSLPLLDKAIIDSALKIYHKVASDTARLNALSIIVEDSWNSDVWPKYNDYILGELNRISPKEFDQFHQNRSDLNTKLLELKANAVNNYGYYQMELSNYDVAIEYYKKSLLLAEKIPDSSLIAVCYNNIANIYSMRGESARAIEYYKTSGEIRSRIGDRSSLATIYNNIGNLHSRLGSYEMALDNLFKSLEIIKDEKSSPKLGILYNNIGDVFFAREEFEKAMEYFVKSKKKHDEINDRRGLALALGRIVDVQLQNKDFENARLTLLDAEKIQGELKDYEGLARTKIRFAELNKSLDNPLKALANIEEGIRFLELIEYNSGLGEIYNRKTEILLILSRFNDGLKSSRKALEISEQTKNKKAQYTACRYLAKIQNEFRNFEEAYKFEMKANNLNEEIQKERKRQDIDQYKQKLDISVRNREIELLNEKNQFLNKRADLDKEKLSLSRRNNLIFLFGLVALVILFVVMFRNFRKQKELNVLLKTQKDDAENLNSERANMLKEIHHRVKNNLQVVSSMLRLQSHEIQDKTTQAIFDSAQQRIYAMALIHEKMYGVKDLKSINTKEYLDELILNIQNSTIKHENFSLQKDIDELILPIEEVIPIGLIINELLSNSMKHAFAGIENPQVNVSLKKDSIGFILCYKDNGVGDHSEKSGLGKELVESFVGQLNGEIIRLDEPGTAYQIKFELS